ncbi:MAG: type II secretion system F family protein [Lachnospiraceae bacterium]|nr:type II secretion system F family protein [Lachnospiraceae bacterium]
MFERCAEGMIDRVDRKRQEKDQTLPKALKSLEGQLKELHPGEADPLRAHRIRKLAGILRITCLCLLVVLAGTWAILQQRTIERNRLKRPMYGQGVLAEELLAASRESEAAIDLKVEARRFSKAEVEELLDRAVEEIDAGLLRENETRNEIRSDLHFPETAADGLVQVTWSTVPYGYIGSSGELRADPGEKGMLVNIQAELSCQQNIRLYQTGVMVYPPALTGKAQFRRELEQALKTAESESATEEYLVLPENVGGTTISWQRRDTGKLALLFLLCLLAPIGYASRQDQAVREQAARRRRELEMDYSSFVWQLALLVGAGMTIRGSFMRIAEGYRKQENKKSRATHEEVWRTVLDMERGVSESRSYERFGRRCALPQYIRLGAQLSANLRKGSRGLAETLAAEAVSAMEEQKNMVRKAGETAGTRMIFPMILMMMVVLIVLMVPALLSM